MIDKQLNDNAGAPVELGTERIGKLLKMYAVPGIIAMTASSLYNMVDSIFIGHIRDVGAMAISGLAVTFPLMNLSVAFGTLVGVGAATMISILLGQNKYKLANRVLGNVVSLNTAIGALFSIVCLAFLDPILRFFGASDSTLPFARQYMTILLIGNIITHLYFGLNGLIRASGNPKTAMGLTIFTVTSNALLDPIFIFVFDMGIKGAALATVLCQALALAFTFKFFFNPAHAVHFDKGRFFSFDWRIAKSSTAIGMGPFLMNFASCIVAIFINQQLMKYGGDLAIGAYGISNRITFMFVMIVMGINQGMQPIAGYNYGAKLYSRVRKVFWLATIWSVIITTCCFLISEFLPGVAVSIFTNDTELKDLSIHTLRTINCGFALVGFGMVSSNFFQSVGMVKKAIFLSLTRQLLFFVPTVYLLPLWIGAKGVLLSFPISDLLNILVAALLIAHTFSRFKKINDGDSSEILGSNI